MNGTSSSSLASDGPGPHAADRQAQAAPVAQAGHVDRLALRVGEQVHLVAEAGERAHHRQHGQRRAAHLEERLRGEEEDAQRPARPRRARRKRPALVRARSGSARRRWRPCSRVPAAVTAWR